jgi:FlaA1/EpsC-like NDP-sugar epimerase
MSENATPDTKAELSSRSWMSKIIALRQLPTWAKMIIMILVDLALLLAVVFLSYAIRLSSFVLPPLGTLQLYVIAPVLSVACLIASGVYTASTRIFSAYQEKRIVGSQLIATLIWGLFLLAQGTAGFARSVVLIYFIISIAAMIILRRSAANVFGFDNLVHAKAKTAQPVLIYGAGSLGVAVVEALTTNKSHRPVAFIDSDPTLTNRRISGLKVYTLDTARDAINRFEASEVIFANKATSRSERTKIIDRLLELGLDVKVVPDTVDLVRGSVSVTDVRPVRLEDLLGRDPVPPIESLMRNSIENRAILITGAGGSIGSELCRQVVRHAPAKVILYELSEFALFEIDRELRAQSGQTGTTFEIVPVLGDVRDTAKLKHTVTTYGVDIIYHAAAYKHVGLVQQNPGEGVLNNVWGTASVADVALACGVKRCVVISTDKAVRPTSVMGASKRLAELYVQALSAQKNCKTVFSMVRFGNVLGSTGSVVPLFREQIDRGGPIQVTHPDVTRYFMLVPEAAELVLQAGALATGGEVFVLDMGEPVKIRDLAETMVELAGLEIKSDANPDGDIAIEYIGLRDGEKLYEELQIGHDVSATVHPRIQKSQEFCLPMPALQTELKRIQSNFKSDNASAAIKRVMELANRES